MDKLYAGKWTDDDMARMCGLSVKTWKSTNDASKQGLVDSCLQEEAAEKLTRGKTGAKCTICGTGTVNVDAGTPRYRYATCSNKWCFMAYTADGVFHMSRYAGKRTRQARVEP